jgi:UDP-glucuronate 4-epimerase
MRILVTGAAGFIGYFTCEALLARGDEVVGLDNINTYYDPKLKEARLAKLAPHRHFRFIRASLEDRETMAQVIADHRPDRIVHLAAQAGVRYSLDAPHAYVQSNIVGFLNILEGVRAHPVEHLVFASSSSVYGANTELPFSEHQQSDRPTNLYGATKKSNELMAHAYAHLFRIPMTGLRFFTVYGPWGRPDMAPFMFTRNIFEGRPIDVYNNGHHSRDFTYIDDIVDGVIRTLDRPPPQEGTNGVAPSAPLAIYNIGNNRPVELLDFIACIEAAAGKPAIKNFLPMQPGDILATFADIDDISRDVGFSPATPVEQGVERLVRWYRDFYAPVASL